MFAVLLNNDSSVKNINGIMKLNTLLLNSHLLAATTPQLLKMNLPTVMIPDIVSSNTEIKYF